MTEILNILTNYAFNILNKGTSLIQFALLLCPPSFKFRGI